MLISSYFFVQRNNYLCAKCDFFVCKKSVSYRKYYSTKTTYNKARNPGAEEPRPVFVRTHLRVLARVPARTVRGMEESSYSPFSGAETTVPFGIRGETSSVGTRRPRRSKWNSSGYDREASGGGPAGGGTWHCVRSGEPSAALRWESSHLLPKVIALLSIKSSKSQLRAPGPLWSNDRSTFKLPSVITTSDFVK